MLSAAFISRFPSFLPYRFLGWFFVGFIRETALGGLLEPPRLRAGLGGLLGAILGAILGVILGLILGVILRSFWVAFVVYFEL